MKNSLKLILPILFCLYGSKGFACSCIGELTVKKALKKADFVFVGKVIWVQDTILANPLTPAISVHETKVTFLIGGTYKGRTIRDTISVFTGVGKGDCGYPFLKDRDYIVYADIKAKHDELDEKSKKFFWTDICHRTTEFQPGEASAIEKYKVKKEIATSKH